MQLWRLYQGRCRLHPRNFVTVFFCTQLCSLYTRFCSRLPYNCDCPLVHNVNTNTTLGLCRLAARKPTSVCAVTRVCRCMRAARACRRCARPRSVRALLQPSHWRRLRLFRGAPRVLVIPSVVLSSASRLGRPVGGPRLSKGCSQPWRLPSTVDPDRNRSCPQIPRHVSLLT